MKVVGKISMIFATIIIIAHTIIPHQHKNYLQEIIHECLFSEVSTESKESNIFHKLEDVIKHINLGEKHLENFRISFHDYNFYPVWVFQVPETFSFKKYLPDNKKLYNSYHYTFTYTTQEYKLSFGLRAPPSI